MKKSLSLAFFIVLFFLPAHSWGEEKDGALLKKVVNKVEVKKSQEAEWKGASKDEALYNHDTIRTLQNSKAEVQFQDLSVTRLAPLSHLEIDIQERTVKLDIGKIFLKVIKGAKPLRVITPAAVAATLGTEFMVEVTEKGETSVTVLEGHIEVLTGTARFEVNEGQSINVTPDTAAGPPQAIDLLAVKKVNSDLIEGFIEEVTTTGNISPTSTGGPSATNPSSPQFLSDTVGVPSPVEPPPSPPTGSPMINTNIN